jgi:hypothetical protein
LQFGPGDGGGGGHRPFSTFSTDLPLPQTLSCPERGTFSDEVCDERGGGEREIEKEEEREKIAES